MIIMPISIAERIFNNACILIFRSQYVYILYYYLIVFIIIFINYSLKSRGCTIFTVCICITDLSKCTFYCWISMLLTSFHYYKSRMKEDPLLITKTKNTESRVMCSYLSRMHHFTVIRLLEKIIFLFLSLVENDQLIGTG